MRLPEIVVLEGAALAGLGRPDEAEATYREALEAARAVGAAPGLWQAARALDDLLTGLGRTEEAASLRAAVDAELDALAVDLAEPTSARPSPPGRRSSVRPRASSNSPRTHLIGASTRPGRCRTAWVPHQHAHASITTGTDSLVRRL